MINQPFNESSAAVRFMKAALLILSITKLITSSVFKINVSSHMVTGEMKSKMEADSRPWPHSETLTWFPNHPQSESF